VLRYGDTGPHVRTLQRLLGMSEMLVHRFGPATLARVRKFQLEQGLEADGVVGRRTWERLLRGVP
jgi:murein L,D-transpeptidase YcbB/YkuD